MAKKNSSNYLAGVAWVAHRLPMLQSPAWRSRSVPLMRILERIEIEHLQHAGTANGNLLVSYGQLAEAGLSRKDITRSLKLGDALGLLRIIQPNNKFGGQIRNPQAYRLTYLPVGNTPPTDEWHSVNQVTADAALSRYKAGRQKAGTKRPRPSPPVSKNASPVPQ